MPKAPSSSAPGVLKRNQACHQCRRRKLKCDANRPCATCIRSHANAVATALPGVEVPEHPDCTYDEVSDLTQMAPEPRNRYERLENKINELEAQLREKEKVARLQSEQIARQQALLQQHGQGSMPTFAHPNNFYISSLNTPDLPIPSTSAAGLYTQSPASAFGASGFTLAGPSVGGGVSSGPISPPFSRDLAAVPGVPPAASSPPTRKSTGPKSPEPQPENMFAELLWPSWPARLPTPDLLHHLVDVFFHSHPHACRILHRPTFLASLTLPPTHPSFPPSSVLHAICAFASLFSPVVDPEPLPDLNNRPAGAFPPPSSVTTFDPSASLNAPLDLDFDLANQQERIAPNWTSRASSPPTTPPSPQPPALDAPLLSRSLVPNSIQIDSDYRYLAEEIFQDKARSQEDRPDSFGERHAKYTKECQDEDARLGQNLFECLQSIVILSWYYYCHSRWVEIWLSAGQTLRYSIPLGLNATPTHGPLMRSWKMPSLLPEPRDTIEAEVRRNTFWLAYCIERWQAASTGWAMTLDDEDISQVLTVKMADFEAGNKVSEVARQRISTPKMLTVHAPEHTDSFTLYVKGTILFSKVKNFNIRFKSKHFYALSAASSSPYVTTRPSPTTSSSGPVPRSMGTTSPFPPASASNSPPTSDQASPINTVRHPSAKGPETIDPRETASFKALDGLITSFRLSFPKELRDPIQKGAVDSDLYVAIMVPFVATILLHDPHADPASPNCRSAEKILNSAREILNLVYAVCSTSYDITLLDPVASFGWFLASRVFVRFLKARIDTGNQIEALAFRNELEVLRVALARYGERIPLGYRQHKMLDEILLSEVGEIQDPNLKAAYGSSYGSSNGIGQTIVQDVNFAGPDDFMLADIVDLGDSGQNPSDSTNGSTWA